MLQTTNFVRGEIALCGIEHQLRGRGTILRIRFTRTTIIVLWKT